MAIGIAHDAVAAAQHLVGIEVRERGARGGELAAPLFQGARSGGQESARKPLHRAAIAVEIRERSLQSPRELFRLTALAARLHIGGCSVTHLEPAGDAT